MRLTTSIHFAIGALVLSASTLVGCGSAPSSSEDTGQSSAALAIPHCSWPTVTQCDGDELPNGKPIISCYCEDLPPPVITSLAAGSQTTYALDSNGILYSWGSNASCALGSHSLSTTEIAYPSPLYLGGTLGLQVDQPKKAKQIAAGDTGACALFADQSVECWGTIAATTVPPVQACAPTAIAGLPAVTQIAHGTSHACAIDTNAFVWCWGDDQFGQLGDPQQLGVPGAGTATAVPVSSTNVHNIVQIVAGGNTTCARRADQAVFCWGDDSQGGLGDGAGAGKSVAGPLQVGGGWTFLDGNGGATSLFGGGSGTFCGQDARSSNTLCWGADQYGQAALTLEPHPTGGVCANGLGCSPSPSLLNESEGPFIALGKNHSCVGGTSIVGGASTLGCVGLDSSGQLGDGASAQEFSLVPAKLPSGVYSTTFAVGDYHTCTVVQPADPERGNVYCWGNGSSGQLGAGLTSSAVPQMISWYP
jgi:alpha-tubulin suppressor-like RCC1 family protein